MGRSLNFPHFCYLHSLPSSLPNASRPPPTTARFRPGANPLTWHIIKSMLCISSSYPLPLARGPMGKRGGWIQDAGPGGYGERQRFDGEERGMIVWIMVESFPRSPISPLRLSRRRRSTSTPEKKGDIVPENWAPVYWSSPFLPGVRAYRKN